MTRAQFLLLPLPVALLSVALALWLSAGPPGRAATAEQQQGTTVQVEGKEISWAPNGHCETAPSTAFAAADFGTSPPGGGQLYYFGPTLEACVLSNAPWSVAAVATDLTDGSESSSSIPAEDLRLTAFPREEEPPEPAPATIPAECADAMSNYCPLDAPTVIAEGSPSPNTTGFDFAYKLTVPAATPSGTYTGSVTFTASN